MSSREWGGHTGDKMAIFAEYLTAFAKASGGSPVRIYIDAFASPTITRPATRTTFRGGRG